MKRILALAALGLLVATAAVRAAPPAFLAGAQDASSLVEASQYRKGKGFKKGKGFFKKGNFKKGRGFGKGPKGRKGAGRKRPYRYSACVAKGNNAMQCNGRCR